MDAVQLPVASRATASEVRPLRVVHLVLTLNIGGLEKVVYDLVRATDKDRCSERVVCLNEIGALGPEFEALGVPVETIQTAYAKGAWRGARALSQRLRELRPDVLHTHNSAPNIVGSLAGRLAGVPAIVHTLHGQHTYEGWKSVLLNRLAFLLTHHVVAVSGSAAKVATTHQKIPARKLSVIWNGIDLERFPQRAASTNGAPRAIHVARMVNKFKDQRTLLQAVKIVAESEPDFILDFVGDGPDRAQVEAWCDEFQVRRHVILHGFRSDVHDLLSQARLFVLSSVTEGLSISLLEAMATGVPTVATEVGGNPELVTHGETGLLVPPRSPAALAAAMLELLRDPSRAARMGQAGRRRVEEHFDLRSVAQKYETLYGALLDESTCTGGRS